ncbi:MAG TPA: hypothetical protein VI390_00230 [Methyloceanibacter sp.]
MGRLGQRLYQSRTYHCITPYVGGGVGFATISVNGLKDVNVPNDSVFYAADHTQTNFAWGVYGGLSYDVTPSLAIDLIATPISATRAADGSRPSTIRARTRA